MTATGCPPGLHPGFLGFTPTPAAPPAHLCSCHVSGLGGGPCSHPAPAARGNPAAPAPKSTLMEPKEPPGETCQRQQTPAREEGRAGVVPWEHSSGRRGCFPSTREALLSALGLGFWFYVRTQSSPRGRGPPGRCSMGAVVTGFLKSPALADQVSPPHGGFPLSQARFPLCPLPLRPPIFCGSSGASPAGYRPSRPPTLSSRNRPPLHLEVLQIQPLPPHRQLVPFRAKSPLVTRGCACVCVCPRVSAPK